VGAPPNPELPPGDVPNRFAGWQPPPGPPPSYQQQGSHTQPGSYPQQTLLPQHVEQSRSRRPLVIGLVVALVVAAGGIIAWQLLRDNGESTRAAYCTALRKLTANGDITTALAGADAGTFDQLNRVQSLAPDVVKGDWASLQSLARSTRTGRVDYASAISALTSLRAISDDAKSKCAITLDVPGLP
jgi:hypothetical protein